MKKRYLYRPIYDLALSRKKMAFVSGPRQVGKTTLGNSFEPEFKEFEYRNWDESSFRKLWTRDPNSISQTFDLTTVNSTRLLVLDEIHKAKGWKQKIKGLYDLLKDDLSVLVTGSARLNVFKKGGDSLMGRYLNFRLHPFSYGELTSDGSLPPEEWKSKIFAKRKLKSEDQAILERLLQMSGFPEPYSENSKKILNIWRQGRIEKIIREDLRDLSRLPELSQVEMLASLMPDKIGSPLSVQSLREDLEVSHDTVKRWLKYLEELFYFFELKPWTKAIARSLKKEGKIYLYDWTEITEDGAKFENLVACHLIKACHFWTDTGEGEFALHYLRNKEKQELDFLIAKDRKPWLTIECKYSDSEMEHKTVDKFQRQTKCPHVQVVFKPDIWHLTAPERLVCSATYLLRDLP